MSTSGLIARLSVLAVLLAEHHPQHHRAVHEAISDLECETQSRGMFVSRLKNMQDNGNELVSVADVLALLNDCDMLAAKPVLTT